MFCIGSISLPIFVRDPYASAPHMTLPQPNDTTSISVGWVGDMVPSGDIWYDSHVLDGVASELSLPDLMIGNLEGTFALPDRFSKCQYLTSMCHAFRSSGTLAWTLKRAGFDVVSLVNNHSYDFGDDGLRDTEAVLRQAGIPFISPTSPTIAITVRGKSIAITGLSSTKPLETITDYDYITRTVTSLKETHDYVIVIFHGGAEGSTKTAVPGTVEYMGDENRGDVQKVAYTAIDAGADLVLGSGPHVLRKVEQYKGGIIAYSLGNFVGGNERLITTGTLGISGIFQATLPVDATYTMLPIHVSKNGTPSIDPLNQAGLLLQNLK